MYIKSVKLTGGKCQASFVKDYATVEGRETAGWEFDKIPQRVASALDALSLECYRIAGLGERHHNIARCYGVSFSVAKDGATQAIMMVTSQPEGLPSPITFNVPKLTLVEEDDPEPKEGATFAGPQLSELLFKVQDVTEDAIKIGKDQGELSFIAPVEPVVEADDQDPQDATETAGDAD